MLLRPPLLFLLTALAAAGCAATGAVAEFTARPVSETAIPDLQTTSGLTFLGGLRLSGSADLGGLSALLANGDKLVALSDAGHWFELRLRYAEDGRLEGAELLRDRRLADLDGRPMQKKGLADSESLARFDGGIVVAFEQRHRLWFYKDLASAPSAFRAPAGLQRLPANSGVEAMTELPDGRLLLIAEDDDDGGTARSWVGRPGAWTSFRYKLEGGFRPSGAALLPSGAVVVLERGFSLLGGFGARLMRLDPTTIGAGKVVAGVEMVRLEAPFPVDNFEGIAVGGGPDGHPRLYLVSDDNFSFWQSTLVYVFRID